MREDDFGDITCVLGAQYGSEGKGRITSYLKDDYDVHVRVGGPNAGHTFYFRDEEFKMQVIPVGWANFEAELFLGRGMLINLEILKEEIERVKEIDPKIEERLNIDPKCGVLSKRFKELEGGTEGILNERIGSTGEGVGEARKARIDRDPDWFSQFGDIAEDWGLEHLIKEGTHMILNDRVRRGKDILIEGTQGYGLSLIHGDWPYTTSADTNVGRVASDIGIPPQWINDVILVARTFPIRVAGNSGPLENEISWESVSKRTGKPVEEVKEKTTVTGRPRRIARWDQQVVSEAVAVNDPDRLAITFIDYLCPQDEGVDDFTELTEYTKAWVGEKEQLMNTPVHYLCTGGEDLSIIETDIHNF